MQSIGAGITRMRERLTSPCERPLSFRFAGALEFGLESEQLFTSVYHLLRSSPQVVERALTVPLDQFLFVAFPFSILRRTLRLAHRIWQQSSSDVHKVRYLCIAFYFLVWPFRITAHFRRRQSRGVSFFDA